MVISRDDQERVRQLLTDAITVLCKNGLSYESQFCIEGLLGITLDEREVFLVKIDETIRDRGDGSSAGIAACVPQMPPKKDPSGVHRVGSSTFRSRGGRARGKPIINRGRLTFGARKRPLFGGIKETGSALGSFGSDDSDVKVGLHCVPLGREKKYSCFL